VPRNYIKNVGHATVTQLQGISVKYFMERIVFREAIIKISSFIEMQT
jgi:hypothetical protein